MKFGFNSISEPAREELQNLGVPVRKENSLWCIFTADYDNKVDENREKGLSIDSSDLRKEYVSQKTTVWKNPDTKVYFYLIGDIVFYQRVNHITDFTTYPATTFETTTLDVVDKSDQASKREFLLRFPPNTNFEEGGRLI